LLPNPVVPKSVVAVLATVGWLGALTGCQMTVATEVQERRHRGEIEVVHDVDGDGVTTLGGDCNDDDPAVFPGAGELCDGLDNDCFDGIDDAGACTAQRSITQTLTADVLFVIDTNDGMAPLLADVGDYAYDLGLEIGGPASNVNVGVVNMEASGELFEFANRSFVAAGRDDGAARVTEWLRSAIVGLPATEERGRGRDSVVALLIDSAEAEVQIGEQTLADTGTQSKADSVESNGAQAGGQNEDPSGPAAVFRRDDAPLTLIFVSRSDDASVAGMETFYRALDLTAAPKLRTAHAVVGFGGRCGDAGVVVDGASYRALAEETGGLVVDLCELSSGDLRDIGRAIADSGMTTSHKLPSDLNPSMPMRLSAKWPSGALVDFSPEAYEFDLETWQLHVYAPPPAGSTITLFYERMPN